MIKKSAIAILTSFLAVALTGCGVGEAKSADASPDPVTPLPVKTLLPRVGDIFASYQTAAALVAESDAAVRARVAGEVIEILVEEGSRVEKGQLLARLDGERLRLEMLQAKTSLDKLTNEYARMVGLHKRGLVSQAMYDGLEFDVQALEAAYKLKRLDYGYTNIRAPISGVVSSRDIKVGRQIAVNDSVFRITNTGKLVAYLKIPQGELAKFSAGEAITLGVDAIPEVLFAATVNRISPTIDISNGTFRITAFVDNQSGRLAPGMFARFSIDYEKHADALLVPTAALVEQDNAAVVFVVKDDAVERRIVQTGIKSGAMVEIINGLESDEAIVIAGQAGLRDGSLVLASRAEPDSVKG